MMNLKIKCQDYELAADWYEGTDASKILFIIPGYSSSKAKQLEHAKAMVKYTDINVLVVDLSGHGDSPHKLGSTSPAQHLLEVVTVFDWIKEHYPDAQVSVSGASYGAFLGAWLTKYRNFDNLVLRAPAIYPPQAFYDKWASRIADEDSYKKSIIEYRKDEDALLIHPLFSTQSAFNGKTLVAIHGDDEIVPYQTTDAYIEAFNANSFITKGSPHDITEENTGVEELRVYREQISSWLKN